MQPETLTVAEYKALLAREMRETGRDGLSQQVFDLARRHGWLAARYPTFQRTRTTPGFPDLTLVRGGRLIFSELKREGKEPTEMQQAWLNELRAVPFVEVYVWRPSDLLSGEIERVLADPIVGTYAGTFRDWEGK